MNKNKTNKLFMAFATGKESTEGNIVKRYIGVAPVFVLRQSLRNCMTQNLRMPLSI